MHMCPIAEPVGEVIFVEGTDIEASSRNAKTYLIIVMLRGIINIILKMHIPFTSLCNLHFDIDYVLQFTMEYIMCVYIFEQRI